MKFVKLTNKQYKAIIVLTYINYEFVENFYKLSE